MYKFEDVNDLPQNDDVHAWLLLQMKKNSPQTLLAFADDGVIWGRWDGEKLILPQEQPALHGKTLQQAYIFDAGAEVRLFRAELGGWKAKIILSSPSDSGRVIVEKQILWGDQLAENQPEKDSGFMRLLAERKGISPQIFPITGNFDSTQCVKLEVHHLVDYNTDGEAYVVASRLAGLSIEQKEA